MRPWHALGALAAPTATRNAVMGAVRQRALTAVVEPWLWRGGFRVVLDAACPTIARIEQERQRERRDKARPALRRDANVAGEDLENVVMLGSAACERWTVSADTVYIVHHDGCAKPVLDHHRPHNPRR